MAVGGGFRGKGDTGIGEKGVFAGKKRGETRK
jgi:hypothetical protein